MATGIGERSTTSTPASSNRLPISSAGAKAAFFEGLRRMADSCNSRSRRSSSMTSQSILNTSGEARSSAGRLSAASASRVGYASSTAAGAWAVASVVVVVAPAGGAAAAASTTSSVEIIPIDFTGGKSGGGRCCVTPCAPANASAPPPSLAAGGFSSSLNSREAGHEAGTWSTTRVSWYSTVSVMVSGSLPYGDEDSSISIRGSRQEKGPCSVGRFST
ncbi:uncharacterized protein Tco025E_00101 [Trypanosoma conorhini]|uniref:Uncharacterized protein n=1 Tax=Trypanosoma conorhini TaxID=83891 RepID=A0A3R7PMQ1_9TRYP|nr:uncharacterized protein Tco025E_00101 [Trypanosoma conorhini]RNF27717.1 hypothetical protein Tco025E_00101 [Trypanosoma conorhini]